MHSSCYEWVRRVVSENGLGGLSVLELGSANVNGTVRDFFSGGPYCGLDIGPGNGVDRVGNSEQLEDADNEWDVVISCEMLEHCARPWRAVSEMARACKSGGAIILSARGYDSRGCWEVHGYPSDYWRVSEGAMRVMAEDAGLDVQEITADDEGPGYFLFARKP